MGIINLVRESLTVNTYSTFRRTHFLRLTFYYFLFFTLILACGRRGDPLAIEPYTAVGVVKDLSAAAGDENIRLTWGLPEDKDFPADAIKGFVIFRAEVQENTDISSGKCECDYRSLDFIAAGKEPKFEYVDKKIVQGATYVYKVVVMDKNNKMSKDSNLVIVVNKKAEIKKVGVAPVK